TRVRHAAANFETDTHSNCKLQCCDASTILGATQDRHLRGLLGRAEEKRRSSESREAIEDFMVNAADRTRRWNRLSKSKNNWGGSARECHSGGGTLWVSGHRCRFRHRRHL